MQNPQYSLQLTNENIDTIQLTQRLKELSTSVFTAISPNINWHNPSHWSQFKRPFKRSFKQIHISATSNDVGKLPNYIATPNLIGGAAILTFDHWASTVSKTHTDPQGHGTYTITTLQGRNGRSLSIIAAYISVPKGAKAGVNTFYSQQVYLMEREALNNKSTPSTSKCPRREAIKALSQIIGELQQQDHAIVLTIDANQTSLESHNASGPKPHSIEWLRMEHGMDDPFEKLHGDRPSSITVFHCNEMKLTWHLLTIAIAMASKVSAISSEVKQKLAVTSLSHDDSKVRGISVPPDPIGAAGPKSIIAVVNTGIQAMDRSGDVKWNATLVDFFKKLQPDPDNTITDPKIVYDIHTSTFAVVLLEIKCELQISNILLAVSTNSNPSKYDWRFQKINAFSNGLWADYPGFEVDEEVIYITARMYACKSEFKHTNLWIVQKKDLSFKSYDNFPGSKLFTYQPAEVRASTGAGKGIGTYLISIKNGQSLSIVCVNDPTGTVTFDQKFVPIDSGNIVHTPYINLPAPQRGTPKTIEAGRVVIYDAVWNKGSLWVTSIFHLNGEVTAVWMQVDVSNWEKLKLTQLGEITGEGISPNTHTYYPSVAVNKDGIAAFGFSASGNNLYAGAYFTWRRPTDDYNHTREAETVGAGVAPYYITFGGDRNRWGDYSGISVDPEDDNYFWVYNQFADKPCLGEGGCYTTSWAQFCIEPKPVKTTTTTTRFPKLT
jgi:hypothetical protein